MSERGRRKSLVGVVVSNKMDKTAVVAVERRERHPLYRKIVRSTKRYKAHDPNNGAVLGDVVRIEESRPLSATKRWRLVEIVQRASEGASDLLVAEEPDTTEAIHALTHAGREASGEALETTA